ncbi:hypothetical protein [Phocaeicola sp.]
MEIEELKTAYGKDFVWELAQKETLSEFMEYLKTKGVCPDDSEAEVLMAALYPLKGQKRELNEEDLDGVNGGLYFPGPVSTPNYDPAPTPFHNPASTPVPTPKSVFRAPRS